MGGPCRNQQCRSVVKAVTLFAIDVPFLLPGALRFVGRVTDPFDDTRTTLCS